jgi:NADP-dependent 3-hydroxy acid dehydrogenase YdfG
MVTGPTSGIGVDTARTLAAAGTCSCGAESTKPEETKRAIETGTLGQA